MSPGGQIPALVENPWAGLMSSSFQGLWRGLGVGGLVSYIRAMCRCNGRPASLIKVIAQLKTPPEVATDSYLDYLSTWLGTQNSCALGVSRQSKVCNDHQQNYRAWILCVLYTHMITSIWKTHFIWLKSSSENFLRKLYLQYSYLFLALKKKNKGSFSSKTIFFNSYSLTNLMSLNTK